MSILSFLLVAIVVFAGTAHAAPLRTLYVAPTGSDSADGGATTPWRTLQRRPTSFARATWHRGESDRLQRRSGGDRRQPQPGANPGRH
jgi:hypothetical protein